MTRPCPLPIPASCWGGKECHRESKEARDAMKKRKAEKPSWEKRRNCSSSRLWKGKTLCDFQKERNGSRWNL